MANYVVLARKWRPSQFSDIVGQGHIVRTIMNAIQSNRIHQAYVLTGSRGIGKTSIARIFAKAIRCENAKWEGDWLKSCDTCASCKEIAAGNSVDVIEIDGASNNGVDAVREIRENAKYLPASGNRKIYIIDEVHMLTTAAFNALLKTLEEPPPHVIFVLATTEPHKIPATILSRVQRFDLRRVTMAQIQSRLAQVTQAEGVQAEAGGLALVARAAEGSMRDALSLLDQVIAYAGTTVSTQAVRDSIGLIAGQTLLGIIAGVFKRKPLEALSLVDQAYQQGHDLKLLTRSVIEFLHAAILAKVGASGSTTLELSEEEWKELASLTETRSLEEIEMVFQVLHHGLDWIARSPQPKLVLDVLLVKCATADALVKIGPLGVTPTGGNSQVSQSTSPQIAANSQTGFTAAPIPAPTQSAPVAATPVTSVASAPAPISSASQTRPVDPLSLIALESQNPSPTSYAPQRATPVAVSLDPAPENLSTLPPSGPISWEGFIAHVRPKRPLLASILEHGHCDHLPVPGAGATSSDLDHTLSICFRPEDAYFKEQLQSRVYSEQLSALTKEYFRQHVRLSVELRNTGESVALKRERERQEQDQAARHKAQNHPIIAEAKALFGGELGPIELTTGGASGGDKHVH